MFNFKIVCNVLFCIVFSEAAAFVLFSLADIYQNKDSRENKMFLCTFIACIAAMMVSFFLLKITLNAKNLLRRLKKQLTKFRTLEIRLPNSVKRTLYKDKRQPESEHFLHPTGAESTEAVPGEIWEVSFFSAVPKSAGNLGL